MIFEWGENKDDDMVGRQPHAEVDLRGLVLIAFFLKSVVGDSQVKSLSRLGSEFVSWMSSFPLHFFSRFPVHFFFFLVFLY